jgi:hypothetical protein
VYPQPIADLQIGNVANGQLLAASADPNLNLGAWKIKRCRVGKDRDRQYQKTGNKKMYSGQTKTHSSILEAIQSCWDGAGVDCWARAHFSLH